MAYSVASYNAWSSIEQLILNLLCSAQGTQNYPLSATHLTWLCTLSPENAELLRYWCAGDHQEDPPGRAQGFKGYSRQWRVGRRCVQGSESDLRACFAMHWTLSPHRCISYFMLGFHMAFPTTVNNRKQDPAYKGKVGHT